jgi:hypothetical protein
MKRSGWRPGSPALFFICMVTVLGIGWAEDNRSCLRQADPRAATQQRSKLIKQFMVSAADTRLYSAEHEQGRQRTIDYHAYRVYMREARQIKTVPTLSCYKFIPDT